MAADRTARVWARIAAAHEGDGPVSVAALCRAAVRCLRVDGASVTATSGLVAHEPLFASDALSARLEELQFTTGEGPGSEDFEFGSPLLIPDLESAAARWPGFVSAAVAAGARAMFALPLQAGAVRVGVLSLYRARPGPLAPAELADMLVFADIALHMVLDTAAGITGSPEYRPLDGLSDRRAEVYQAIGMISVQLDVDLEEAFVRLRAHAFASGAALGAIARPIAEARSAWSRRRPSRPGSWNCSRSRTTRAHAWTVTGRGQVVVISDIQADEVRARWPKFAAAAGEMGFAGVHAIPMRLRDQVIGTLNLFRAARNGLDPAVALAARALVDVATIGILQERAVHQQEIVAGQLQVALNSRVMIEQTKGILAERLGTTPDEAFLILRRYARDHNRPLTKLASDVIHGTAGLIRDSKA